MVKMVTKSKNVTVTDGSNVWEFTDASR